MKKIIRLTESELNQVVKDSVKRILREYSDDEIMFARKQNEVKRRALEALSRMGYKDWGGNRYADNPTVLVVSINDYRDCSKIKSMLSSLFKTDEIGVKYESNLVGKDSRAVIYLPTFNKITEAYDQFSDEDFASSGDPYELEDDNVDPTADVSHITPNDLRKVYVWETGDSYYEFEADYGEGMSDAVSIRGSFDGDFHIDDVVLGHSGFGRQMNQNDIHTSQFEEWFNSTLGDSLSRIISQKIEYGDFANDAESGY